MAKKIISIASYQRAMIALSAVDELYPLASPKQRRKLASKLLAMVWEDRAGIASSADTFTELQARELIEPNFQCIQRNCAGLFAWEPISRALRMWFKER